MTIRHGERHVHSRALRESIHLLNYPVIGGFFATARAGAARAGKPNVFNIGAVVAFTMEGFTAQDGFAAGECFSDFRDFNIAKCCIVSEHLNCSAAAMFPLDKSVGILSRLCHIESNNQ
ncbi:hypothetical protein GCM10007938_37860 [Vibrio zhanjiangensis]|uniref:Uncharacterized protein n=1 Tax=Vibrio zhanjiangensis TaxID=1046128 RepID=A0ABQ6F3A6_9VIBR|nr:hypothetical protein [Vibrio zhanjiangensis]GLT20003.1 hypothetical protein GCM10007938_37860 [Vibrio zhanjiangensis]